MNTDQLITQAIHAINTNQPRMANLYMRKALEQVDAHRRELDPLAWQGRKLSMGMQNFVEGIAVLSEGIGKAMVSFIEAFQTTPTKKSDYVLAAGKSK